MIGKKGAMMTDFLSYAIVLLFGSVFIMGVAFFVIAPSMGERAEASVTANIAEFNENLFLFNYLRTPVGDKTIADLVIEAYIKKDYTELESETKNFLILLYSQEKRVCCSWSGAGVYGAVVSYYWRNEGECKGNIVSNEFCINWRIYINDNKVIDGLHVPSNEKTIHEAYIPNYYNLGPINFKFIFY